MLWENLKCQEFPEAVKTSKGVCVIPIGAMEKHGLHLGVGIDSIAVEEVAGIFKVFKDDEELLKQNEEWNNAW